MSHSAEKCKRGTLLDLLTYILLQNFKKLEGDPLGTLKNFRKKVAQCPKKSKGGTLWTKFALAVGGFRIVSKKWTDQCEDCSLKKKRKKGHCYSRAFFLKRKTRRLKRLSNSHLIRAVQNASVIISLYSL